MVSRELTNTIKQRYRINTQGKSCSELEQILKRKGVKGFVVNVNQNRITMLVDRKDILNNRRKSNEIT